MAERVHAVLARLGVRLTWLPFGDNPGRSERPFPHLLIEGRTPDVPTARPGEDQPLGHRRPTRHLPRQGDLDWREPLHALFSIEDGLANLPTPSACIEADVRSVIPRDRWTPCGQLLGYFDDMTPSP